MKNEKILEALSKWDDIIAKNREDFEKEFCHESDLLGTWYSTDSVKVWFMSEKDGVVQHFSDSFPMDKFLEFVDKSIKKTGPETPEIPKTLEDSPSI